MAIGFGIASRNWWRAQIKGGVSPSFSLDFANIANDFTFTRNSFATRVNELGLIETVTDLGNELVVNGDFATDSDWSKLNATISGGKGNLDGDGQTSLFWQSILTNGKTYKATFTISDYNELGEARLVNNNGTTIYTITSNGTFTINFTHNIADGNFLFRARTGAIFSVDNVSVKEVLEDDVPRIDYTNGEAAFLLEPQSTNLLPYSEDFSQSSWAKLGNSAFGFVTGVAPDGNTSVYEITSNGTGGNLQYIISGLSVNTEYTLSFYVKQTSATTLVKSRVLSLTGGSGGSNLTQVNYQDQLVTDEWVRITHTFTTDDTLGNYIVYVSNALTSGESLQFWGAQLEQLPYATSYIPTNGSVVTRSAETCVDATPTINSEEGVLYAEISALIDGGVNRDISLSDGTSSNRVQLIFSSATNRLSVGGVVGGVGITTIDYNSFVQTDNHKIAFKYSADGVKLFVDGVERGSSTDNVSFPIGTLTDLDFSLWNSSSLPFYGRTKDLKIYDKALTDEELITFTSI